MIATSAMPMSLVSMQMQEPTSQPVLFRPGWHNVWEASLCKNASRHLRTHNWMFQRFGGDAPLTPRKTHLRDALHAFNDTCHLALNTPEAQRHLRRRNAQNAMIFFDSWGESSLFEAIDNWRDSLFCDILPKKIAWTYKIQAFSSKLRGERNGFLLALEMAQDCLHSGVADNVVICGQHRHYPVMTLSETLGWPAGKARHHCGGNTLFAVERNVCLLVSRMTDSLPTLSVSPRRILPQRASAAVAQLTACWQAADCTQIYSTAPPTPALLSINQRAGAPFSSHLPLYAHYGDSGCLNPALGLHLWHNDGAPAGPGLISSLHAGHSLWLVRCQPAAASCGESDIGQFGHEERRNREKTL
ncbi:hypothetical protein AAGR22_18795 [Erwinia sp. HDF1-3R]|uniref:hypothetical protein n=1 Tax=Erwinia sp. HDF1-3R TaxID=3141543 RepID=UPI0031F52463